MAPAERVGARNLTHDAPDAALTHYDEQTNARFRPRSGRRELERAADGQHYATRLQLWARPLSFDEPRASGGVRTGYGSPGNESGISAGGVPMTIAISCRSRNTMSAGLPDCSCPST
jgi:hypothetical protein